MTHTTDKALDLALEALELSAVTVDSFGVQKKTQEAITAIKQSLSAPVQEPVAWVDLLKQAEEVVRSKSLWKKYIDGTPLANDIAVWMASFAQEHTTLPAQPAPVQADPDEQVIRERDEAEEIADALAEKIAAITGCEIGEHTSANSPWHSALDAADEFLASRPPAAQPAPVQEPFGYLFQHEETGLTTVVDVQQVDWGFEKNNPRHQKIGPVYTTPPAAPVQPVMTDEKGRPISFWGGKSVEPIKQPAPASWMEMVTANLVREGVNKHKARELAEHFYGLAQRPFVGLTDEERLAEVQRIDPGEKYLSKALAQLSQAIEAKLRSKNNENTD